jgi:hypothetical protein
MPLYLVRWPRFDASIVHAESESHLTDILDEVASPTEATWVEYNGPLWVDIQLGLQAEEKGNGTDWTVQRVEEAAREPWLGAKFASSGSETEGEMLEAVFDAAFPNLARVLEDAEEAGPSPDQVRDAALADLRAHRGSGVLPGALRAVFERSGPKSDDD